MQTFSVFALSSVAEGTPVTLLEAMSTGLPVVSTGVGGIPALVAQGETGLLVPVAKPTALAAALETYASDPALALRHGAAGRTRIERHYSIATMLFAYAELYDALLKKKSKFKPAAKPCTE